MFEAIDPSKSFSDREEEVLTFWQEKGIFYKSLAQREHDPVFSFYDGPPFATGLPHYGHILAGTIKDVVPRYKTMKGYFVPRRFGWDCHGLPVENEIEKSNNLTGAPSIEAFGIGNFNEECRRIVLRYTQEWQTIVERMGRWVDFKKTYKTMDRTFMESVWWVFKELYNKGLVYEGYKVMPYSWKLGTPLSNFEAGENYQEIDDPSLTVLFRLTDDHDAYFVAWTTTPWTLISNLAVTAGPDIDYVKFRDPNSDKKLIMAEKRLQAYFKNPEELVILERYKGTDLAGMTYEPLFSYFADKKSEGAFRVIVDDFVSLDDGTGFVHTAPGFGENDFYACQRNGISVVCPVDQNGCFTNDIPEYAGRMVKECDKEIIRHLKQEGSVLRHDTIRHRYPFCWRSDTPLIYKAVSTWFVAVEKVKDLLLATNQEIYWSPEFIKNGRFGKWLEGARDWAISRNRYWGTPIPIWRAEDGDILVMGSIEELECSTGKKYDDIHRHFIDNDIIVKNGKSYKRISEVFDCWFESGSMPYAQNHYPFENKELFLKSYPADFIAEGLDQTRGWFYTLHILAGALFQKPAFKNCVVNGIVLAADGAKMSKRLKNYPDPMEMVHKYGADAVRLYLLHSPAVRAEDLCFTEAGVEGVLRQILLPLWNSYSFFLTYARLYGFKPEKKEDFSPRSNIDRWILSLMHKLIHEVEDGMDRYVLSDAVEPFVHFVEELTNWYIRRSRRRFWNDADTPDRREAFQTLYIVLKELVKIAAPFVPFIADEIFRNLRTGDDPESVHLADYPKYREAVRDTHLEEAMELVQIAASLGHKLRKDEKIKVRQPLAKAFVISTSKKVLSFLEEEKALLADELNVFDIEFSTNEREFVELKPKSNFRVLGKRFGKLMRDVDAAVLKLTQDQLKELLETGSIEVEVAGQKERLSAEEVLVDRHVREGLVAANQGMITIALDTKLNEELISLGFAREIVNKINTMRKEHGFSITDRIDITIETSDAVRQAIEQHRDYIFGEILALSCRFDSVMQDAIDINGESAKISLQKVERT